ncbi:MAG: NOL1/NOP2/sun family putative RNA methylase [Candidatus Baldrarchaeia archaeon]
MNRNYLSEKANELAKKYGYLPYIIERYLLLFGERETLSLLEANERGLNPVIRCNTLRADPSDLYNSLSARGVRLRVSKWVDYAFEVLNAPFSLASTPEYLLGHFYIHRGPATLLPPIVLMPEPGDVVIDMAAAPGGKTSHLAQIMKNKGVIIAIDIDKRRMKSLRSNLSRLGIENVIAIRMDARRVYELGLKANKILLDAPCSGEGLIPIDKSRKKSRTLEDIKYCSKLQEELLRSAIKCLEEGGEIVYSTCSIAPEENEFVIDKMLKEFPLKVVRIDLDGDPGFTEAFGMKLDKSLRHARRLYPHKHLTEGFFICKLRLEERIRVR